MSTIATRPDRAADPLGDGLRLAAGATVVVAMAAVVVAAGEIIGLRPTNVLYIFAYVPLAIPFALAAVIAPPVLVLKKLKRRASAIRLIRVLAAGSCFALLCMAVDVHQNRAVRDRWAHSTSALTGLHGERDGIRVELQRRVGYEGETYDIELVVWSDAADRNEDPQFERYGEAYCDTPRTKVVFGGDGHIEVWNAIQAVMAQRTVSTHSEADGANRSRSYCSLQLPGTETPFVIPIAR